MKLALCCAADEKTKYLTQAVRWARSVRSSGTQADLYIGLTDPCPDYYQAEFDRLGAALVAVPRASSWHGPSNKLGVLLDPRLAQYDFVILSDCDVVVTADISAQCLPGKIRAKPADFATLPDDTLEALFQAAGQPMPARRVLTSIDRVWKHPYCNSGFIVFPGALLQEFMQRWLHWNEFVLANSQLLGERVFFSDQASFALALAEYIGHYDELPVEMNFPCHVALDVYPVDLHECEPVVLHYHDRIDAATGLVLPTSLPGPDRVISRFNALSLEQRRAHPAELIFWDELHYRQGEAAGPAPMAPNAALAAAVKAFVSQLAASSLTDFGCGDSAWLDDVEIPGYVGIDGSREAVERSRKRNPGRTYQHRRLQDCAVAAPTSLCLGVLAHQPSEKGFHQVLDTVVALTQQGGLVSGLDTNPVDGGNNLFFYTPLAAALAARGLGFRLLATVDGQGVYQWWRTQTGMRPDTENGAVPERATNASVAAPEAPGIEFVDGRFLAPGSERMIIGILTCEAHADRANAVRNSWLKVLPPSFRVLFIHGRPGVPASIEGDCLYVDCPEAYEALPLKVHQFLRYCLDELEFDYLFKTDDDTWLDLERFIGFDKQGADYIGQFRELPVPELGRTWHYGKCTDKTFEVPYAGEFTCAWATGAGYFLSRHGARVAEEKIRETSVGSLFEDLMIGEALTREPGISVLRSRFAQMGLINPLLPKDMLYVQDMALERRRLVDEASHLRKANRELARRQRLADGGGQP